MLCKNQDSLFLPNDFSERTIIVRSYHQKSEEDDAPYIEFLRRHRTSPEADPVFNCDYYMQCTEQKGWELGDCKEDELSMRSPSNRYPLDMSKMHLYLMDAKYLQSLQKEAALSSDEKIIKERRKMEAHLTRLEDLKFRAEAVAATMDITFRKPSTEKIKSFLAATRPGAAPKVEPTRLRRRDPDTSIEEIVEQRVQDSIQNHIARIGANLSRPLSNTRLCESHHHHHGSDHARLPITLQGRPLNESSRLFPYDPAGRRLLGGTKRAR